MGAENGLFRYESGRVSLVKGEKTGAVEAFEDTPTGLLVGAENGLFRYESGRVVRVPGEEVGPVSNSKLLRAAFCLARTKASSVMKTDKFLWC